MYPYQPSKAEIKRGVRSQRNAGERLAGTAVEPQIRKPKGPQSGDILNVGTLAGATAEVPEAPWKPTGEPPYRMKGYLGHPGDWIIRTYVWSPE